MGILDEFFGGGQEQAYGTLAEGLGRAGDVIKKAGTQAVAGQQPFITAGTDALGEFQQQLGEEKDPVSFINNILDKYKLSPFAKFQIQQGTKAANRAAAAAGLLGGGAEQKALQQFGQQVSSQDMQQFLENVLGVQAGRMSGLGQLIGRGQLGATTAGQFGTRSASELADFTAQEAAAQARQQEAHANALHNLLSTIASVGGAVAKGPIGAWIGRKFAGEPAGGGGEPAGGGGALNEQGFSPAFRFAAQQIGLI